MGALGGRFRKHDAEAWWLWAWENWPTKGTFRGVINRFGGVKNQVKSLNSRVPLDGQLCLENSSSTHATSIFGSFREPFVEWALTLCNTPPGVEEFPNERTNERTGPGPPAWVAHNFGEYPQGLRWFTLEGKSSESASPVFNDCDCIIPHLPLPAIPRSRSVKLKITCS